jgi:hypothetical protein
METVTTFAQSHRWRILPESSNCANISPTRFQEVSILGSQVGELLAQRSSEEEIGIVKHVADGVPGIAHCASQVSFIPAT